MQQDSGKKRMEIHSTDPGSLITAFQKGVFMDVPVGITIMELLTKEWGFSGEFAENRIQTVFLDGKPVDDPKTAKVRDGSVLAFSSAMPGLVGATLRKGGVLAGLRSGISYFPDKEKKAQDTGRVCRIMVKLFNQMIKEMGEKLLKTGFLAPCTSLPDTMKHSGNSGCIGDLVYIRGKE